VLSRISTRGEKSERRQALRYLKAFSVATVLIVGCGPSSEIVMMRGAKCCISPKSVLEESKDISYFSPFHDSKRVMLVTGEKTCKVRDLRSGSLLAEREFGDILIRGIAISPDDRMAAIIHQQGVVLWHIERDVLTSLEGGANASICQLAFSPSGDRIAALAEMRILLWDDKGNPVRLIEREEIDSFCTNHDFKADASFLGRRVFFSPDGKWFLVAGDEVLGLILDATKGDLISGFGHWDEDRNHIANVTVMPMVEGTRKTKYVLSSTEGSVRLWEVPSARQVSILRCPNSYRSFGFGATFLPPDGEFLAFDIIRPGMSTSPARRAVVITRFPRVFSDALKDPIATLDISRGLARRGIVTSGYLGVETSSDGKYLLTDVYLSDDKCQKTLWRTQDWEAIGSFSLPGWACFTPDSRLLMVGNGKARVMVWELPGARH